MCERPKIAWEKVKAAPVFLLKKNTFLTLILLCEGIPICLSWMNVKEPEVVKI